MLEFLSWIAASFVTIPLISYILVFTVVKGVTKNHRLAVNWALDICTLFLIFAVHVMISVIWNHSYLWVILLILIGIAILFVMVHWYTKEEFRVGRALRGFWRFNFLLFISAYLLLMIYGLVMRVTISMTMP